MLCMTCLFFIAQPPAAVSILPKLPRLYLEAGAALLMARRPADCLTLCDEVSRTTVDLLPEKVIVDDPEEGSVSWSREWKDETESGLERLLWAAASYLLQGHCYCQLMEWKQAVTNYTRSVFLDWFYADHLCTRLEINVQHGILPCRCINLVVKVHYKRRSRLFFLKTL